MARGRGKQRGGGRGGRKLKKQRDSDKYSKFNNKRDFSNLKDDDSSKDTEGNDGVLDKKRRLEETQPTNEVSSDEESIEEQPIDHLKELLSTFNGANENAHHNAIDTESESSSSESTDLEDADLPDSDKASEHGSDVNADQVAENAPEDQHTESSYSEDSDVADEKPRPMRKAKGSIKQKSDASSGVIAESDDDEEAQENDEEENSPSKHLDPYARHFFYDMSDSLYETVSKAPVPTETHRLTWPALGQLVVRLPKLENCLESQTNLKTSKVSIELENKYTEPGTIPERIHNIDMTKLFIKPQIQVRILKANGSNIEEGSTRPLTPLQTELFLVMNNYQDLYYPSRTLENGEEIRFSYVLHAVNHIMKARDKILHHNAKLLKKDDVPDDFRDQGLMRPKVLILVPFRDSAFRVVKMITSIMFREVKANVNNMKRFVDEFTGNEIQMPKFNPRPEDYQKLFSGNTDDSFRVGLKITKKSLQLYSPFYSSDIIIASPLGLRVVVGAPGEPDRDFDFLASIEMLILDQTELFFMQNWDHLMHLMDHFHLQPKESHDTDYSRVRSWALNGWARFYRQTLLFSSVMLPEMNALFNKRCHNYAGNVRVVNPITKGSICQIVVQLPLVFHRFDADSPSEAIDTRFDLFTKEILPQYKPDVTSHTMFYIPSYFDFVRVRNFLKEGDLEIVQICEYSADKKIARARDIFFNDGFFMLYTERVHFFRRLRIKGIRHLVFYQPPSIPHLFSEMCNLMQDASNRIAGALTVTVLYSKYDIQQLSAIVGIDRANTMVTSKQNVHMFVTGD